TVAGKSLRWVVVGSSFDRISHDWLLTHVPVERSILHKWLKAGFMDESVFHPTESGTPQGGVLTPPTQQQTWRGVPSGAWDGVPNQNAVAANEDVLHEQPKHFLAVGDRGALRCLTQAGEKAGQVVRQGEAALSVDDLCVERVELRPQADLLL